MRLEYFEMIDAVQSIDTENGVIRTESRLPETSPVFDGHFPTYPILPGVMMLEIMNHAAGYLIYMRLKRERFVFLGGVKRAKFRRMVEPGATIITEARIDHDGSGFFVASSSVSVDGTTTADAEIVMIATDFPNDDLRREFERVSSGIRWPADMVHP